MKLSNISCYCCYANSTKYSRHNIILVVVLELGKNSSVFQSSEKVKIEKVTFYMGSVYFFLVLKVFVINMSVLIYSIDWCYECYLLLYWLFY